MKKLFTLAVVMVFCSAAVMAQSKEKTATTKQVVQKADDSKQSATKDLSAEEIEAIKQRASKATRVTTMQTQEQLDAKAAERRKNAKTVQKVKTSDQ